MVNYNKISNAEMLRKIYAVDEAYREEHDGASLISNDLRELIEDCEEHCGKDDFAFNRRFNNQLKSVMPADFGKEIKNKRKWGILKNEPKWICERFAQFSIRTKSK